MINTGLHDFKRLSCSSLIYDTKKLAYSVLGFIYGIIRLRRLGVKDFSSAEKVFTECDNKKEIITVQSFLKKFTISNKLMAENLSIKSGADVSDNDKELQFEISTKTNQSSTRKHFTWTCPSLYQVNPGTIKEGTSFDILREFMSRPDQAPQIYSKALSRETSMYMNKIKIN
ncbi:hypothetical protein PPACK8108_LOCUS21512 [Phakopsora pachyrhizi]|uniref:Uncharacterized protein n=1 Tax=Phakopsora pachyrhizi TaxID=170000 RepID=A0AAV0BMK8_PHAPC|nr:hypothetical protein PPACK8108_LOCUS21512 [Phakopsora pachyrhizi]